LEFDYPNPGPGFDHSKVKGRVGRLVRLAEKDYDKATALEVAAGGRLYQIVVDNEEVGSTLLKMRLKNRVTFIPINKMNPFVVHQSVRLCSYYFRLVCLTKTYCTEKRRRRQNSPRQSSPRP